MLDLYLKVMDYLKREEGQDLVEYALIMGLIALVCVVAITAAGGSVSAIWTAIQGALKTAQAAT